MNNLIGFYNYYHRQNSRTLKLINSNNVTYFSIIRFLESTNFIHTSDLVLDVGCGVGTLTMFIAKKAKAVLGIDISDRAISFAEENRKANSVNNCFFRRFDVNQLYDISMKFDKITATEIVEHVSDDVAFFRSCNKLLKKNGKMFISTQLRGSLIHRLGLLRSFDAQVGHVRRFSEPELTKKIESAGFLIQEVKMADGLLRMFMYTTRFGILLRLIRGPLVPAFQKLDYLSGLIFGFHDVQIIATKSARP